MSAVADSYPVCIMDNAPNISSALVGRACTSVVRFDAESWRFDFEGHATLDVRCPWRIVANGRIALGNGDHGQQFGLAHAVDAVRESQTLLSASVVKVDVRAHTADLLIGFSNDVALEVFNSSSGYEGWECSSKDGLLAIAAGGGELQLFSTDPPLH